MLILFSCTTPQLSSNNAPNPPSNPILLDNATNVSITPMLSWEEQRMSNANYPAVVESDLRKIIIPILPRQEIVKISDNMKEITSLLRKSRALHHRAMSELEKLLSIEGGL